MIIPFLLENEFHNFTKFFKITNYMYGKNPVSVQVKQFSVVNY